MSLADTFQNAARTAFGVFAAVAVSARYESVATSIYDASSGVVSTLSRSRMVSMIFDTYSKALVDGDRIKPQDVKALALPDGFPLKPVPDDVFHVVESNCSVSYRVISVETDPALALYILQSRRNG